MSTNGHTPAGRIRKLETIYKAERKCPTCGGAPTRVAFLHDDHVEENMPPSGCPRCARQPIENVVIDLREESEPTI